LADLTDFTEGLGERIRKSSIGGRGGGGDAERVTADAADLDFVDFMDLAEGLGERRADPEGIVGGGGGGEEGGALVDAASSSASGGGGGASLGGGIMGGGKSAAVGETLVDGGIPAAFSSSRLCSTHLASSYNANP
jgi:hypothetical protein